MAYAFLLCTVPRFTTLHHTDAKALAVLGMSGIGVVF
jgi:hypothetical protein